MCTDEGINKSVQTAIAWYNKHRKIKSAYNKMTAHADTWCGHIDCTPSRGVGSEQNNPSLTC